MPVIDLTLLFFLSSFIIVIIIAIAIAITEERQRP
jgi:hypothetical protein